MSIEQNTLLRRPRGGASQEQFQPFISTAFISAPTQRLCALSAYVVIWAIKVYHLFLGEVFLASNLLSCCALDLVFFVVLWALRIPWLQFRGPSLLLIIISSCFLNLTLFHPRWPIDVGLTAPIKNLASWGPIFLRQQFARFWGDKVRAVSSEDIIKINGKGKHTVRFLPFATAKINPDDSKLCLQRKPPPKKSTSTVNIPILFNKTIPRVIEYSRVDPESGIKILHNFTKRDIELHRIIDKIQNIAYVFIPVQEPGVYRLEQAWDWDWINIKLYRREEIIAYCPDGRFSSDVGPDRCLDDIIPVELILQGVPPFNVYYERIIGDTTVNMTIDGITPENDVVPIRNSQAPVSAGYQWARDQTVKLPMNLTSETATEYSLKILHVRDFFNNTQTYINRKDTSDVIKFLVHPRPSARFQSDSTIKIKPGDSPNIAVDLHGQGPWRLLVGYWAEDISQGSDSTSTNTNDTLEFFLEKPSDDMITVKKPGLYKLLSVSDAFCPGQILAPSSCIVLEVLPPSVKLESIPIPAGDCPGEIGLEVIMTLTGSPPWLLEYSIVHEGKERSIPVHIFKSRHSFTIQPETSGQHDYKFKRLSDFYYREGIEIGHTVSQVVHPKPDAILRAIPGNQLNTCVGSQVDLDVKFSGTGPFTLTYDVLFNRQKNIFTIGDIQGPYYVITSPPFDNPGTYTVTLEKIKDSKGCSKILKASDDIIINVMKERPSVGFRLENEVVTFLEGDYVDLPLQLTGNPSWEVSYRYHASIDKDITIVQLEDPNSHLKVNQPGQYELLEVKDLYCYGKVIPELKYANASWLPRPILNIAEGEAELLKPGFYQRRNVCEGTEDSVGVILQGRAPWSLEYRIQANGNYSQKREVVGGSTTRIPLLTKLPGRYLYEFQKLSDDIYTTPHNISLTLEQIVIKNPSAKFLPRKRDFHHCVGNALSEEESLVVELEGMTPFTVLFEIRHQSSNQVETVTVDEIYTTTLKFRPRTKFPLIGKYTITILHIIDSHHCGQTPEGPDVKLELNVSDLASIERLFSPEIHCVGDLLVYSLKGSPPFNITYTYNGEIKYAFSETSVFTFGADKPGNMTITKVCQQADMCCGYPVDFNEVIYDLPTAIVSEGKDIISDIREGDKTEIIVNFLGIPPFRFTYTRSEILPNGKKGRPGRVIETQDIINVRGYQHSIFTAQQGVFQVTHVADKYCEYPRDINKNHLD
ncbi:hypothetical protein G9A89_020581 [Geosiphon pyriformis]|nr:hypothetical protein G9A89_020581 [Geosiphon pyriformis]